MPKLTISFAWYDFWIGAYYDRRTHRLFICPLPMLLISIDLDAISTAWKEGK
jgi:hypothetical protein